MDSGMYELHSASVLGHTCPGEDDAVGLGRSGVRTSREDPNRHGARSRVSLGKGPGIFRAREARQYPLPRLAWRCVSHVYAL